MDIINNSQDNLLSHNSYLLSFSRRKGRKFSLTNKDVIEQFIYKPFIDKNRLDKLCTEYLVGFNRYHLDVGFGCGEVLFNKASVNSDCLFIGCEPYVDGIMKLYKKIQTAALTNILIFPDDARIILGYLPDNFLSSISILFPDPWPKNRHHKRRLINKQTLNLLTHKLKLGALVEIATDHEDYANHITDCLFNENDHWLLDKQSVNNREECQKLNIDTRYANKALQSNASINYFRLSLLKSNAD